MFGTQDLAVFVVAGLLLNLTPGADTLYIVGRAAAQGARAGAVAALGVGAGCLAHVAATVVGVSALLAASPAAFAVVRVVGAAYLIGLGVSMLFGRGGGRAAGRAGGGAVPAGVPAGVPLRRVFWQGFLTNALNPKVALFFVAFLPQFVAPDARAPWSALLFLGLVFGVNGTLWNLFVGWAAARVAARAPVSPAVGRWLARGCGLLFVVFGIRLVGSTR